MKEIYISGDHAGFELKEKMKNFLDSKKIIYKDFGPKRYNKEDDYPDFILPMIKSFNRKKNVGLIFAGSGEGEAILANKFNGIRASVYYGKNSKIPKLAREHNDSNILCIGAFFVNEKEAKIAITSFIKTRFLAGRHKRRLRKIDKFGS